MRGRITAIVAERGFGFIESPELAESLFFHVKDLDPISLPWDEELIGREVRFEVVTRNGRERAVAVRAAN
ncbi:MAG TPA: cold shock domain-containing protein [Pirellulales bacterium]|jgi:cold shock CspA family protein